MRGFVLSDETEERSFLSSVLASPAPLSFLGLSESFLRLDEYFLSFSSLNCAPFASFLQNPGFAKTTALFCAPCSGTQSKQVLLSSSGRRALLKVATHTSPTRSQYGMES